ncbi:MAG TPA: nucleotide exchange factor GrpE [Candidatus Binatia bacterium]|jgi:molecular chaperone GrpE
MEATEPNKNRPTTEPPAEIERLKEELRREHDLYLRALADFENYRRRVERDRASAAQSGKRDVILPLLEVLDGFERALQIDDTPPSVTEGLLALQRQFLRLLEAQGIAPLESVGQPFNPELHDAIGVVQTDEVESGAVAEELQRGYRWGDDVLRPARVRVAR